MAKPISDEALQLKIRARRRILGAVALVIAVVVLLPMVLDSTARRDAQQVAIDIPAPDKAPPFNPPLKPAVPAESLAPPMDVRPPSSSEPANAVSKSAPAEVVPFNREVEKKTEAVKPAENRRLAEAGKTKDAKAGKFAVQIGVFAKPENAEQAEARLKENKIRHYTETLKSPPGAIRVRAGPYANRAEAESALTRMKLAGISGGVVVSE